MASETTEIREKSLNFLEEIIEESIAKGETRVQTRFPPEPNGYLHIGHAKSICINFGLAKKYGGKCNLRFDDTNPVKEDVEYVDSIKRDIQWLGFQWELERYASDYFDQLYEWAVELIKKGLAYVDDQTQEQIRENRGTVSVPGTPSPWRDRSVEENLDLFERMKNGEFPDGAKVLRMSVSRRAGRWQASLTVERADDDYKHVSSGRAFRLLYKYNTKSRPRQEERSGRGRQAPPPEGFRDAPFPDCRK